MKKPQASFVPELIRRLNGKNSYIQVVLGPRQVGKTTGVLQCLEALSAEPQHYVSADDHLSPGASWLDEAWQRAVEKDSGSILVIDEIQKVPEWSSVLKSRWDEQKRSRKTKIRVVVLGSASLSLQKGLAESLTGRFEILRAFHWSFAETLALCRWPLEKYLAYGGYPGSYDLVDEEKRFRDYILHSILETVIGKDILHFSRVRSPTLFRQAFEILCHYPACEISYNKLLGQLQEKGNIDLVKYYIALYEGAFLLSCIHKFSMKVHLKKSSSPKVIPLCPSLITGVGYDGATPEARGRIFEACVGSELLRTGGELSYWREGNDEVDYVLKKDSKIYAIEVKSGKKRSGSGLDAFRKKYPKAKPVFITFENFPLFSANQDSFLDKL